MWQIGQGNRLVDPTGEGTRVREGTAMEGPRPVNGKTTTPALTRAILGRIRFASAAVPLNPHTCLRRLTDFEGASEWGIPVHQWRSTTLRNGNIDPRPSWLKRSSPMETTVESWEGAMALVPPMAGC